MTPRAPVRVGLVGAGGFGSVHANNLVGLAEADLVAVVDRRAEALTALAARHPGVKTWTSLDRALDESGAEAWVVATSTASHVDLAEAILARGMPVLLEKPVAEDLAGAERLRPAVKPDSSNLMMGHVVLFNSEFRQLAAEAASRGPIAYINCVRHRGVGHLAAYPGESPFHLTMVHDLYCVLTLMQRAEPIRFSAQAHRHASGGCDLAAAQLAWENGTMASFAASFLAPAGMEENGYDRTEVFGDGWAARMEPNPRAVEIWDDRARRPLGYAMGDGPDSPSGMLADELRCFCGVVRGEESVPMGATYDDALQIQGWLERLGKATD